MKKYTIPSYDYPDEMSLPLYPGESLADVIEKALLNGVPGDLGSPVDYDDEDSSEFAVDPYCDIRTDRFLLAELAEHGRQAAQMMTDSANNVDTSKEVVSESGLDSVASPSSGETVSE
ncbi:hypothetical protein [Sigmofec virus UA08Rod_6079]|uniref:Uncharacterized protein n=1 Tax=Sigmofec virus UA08Rod_6079 TaxID=2929450 RepID=A0A976R7X2_9VIRU|nr:hypothetical protein [Sigmofec virus UA08Rod_6079]